MEKDSKIEYSNETKSLTTEIQKGFSLEADDENAKWLLLKKYYSKYLLSSDCNKAVMASYVPVLSVLLEALRPTLFHEKWQERLFDDVFLKGILHESFLLLVKRLEQSEKYAQKKIMDLLTKFCQSSSFESMFLYQCVNHKNWELKYVSQSNIWDDMISAIISLPERIANVTQGNVMKIFSTKLYIPLILSCVFKVLHIIYEKIQDGQDSSLEFLAKLTGRICLIGHADIVAQKFLKELLVISESDYLWRRISENFISKMPSNSLDSFITSLLLNTPWYGYLEWILGDLGIKNEKLNYIMTVKLLFVRPFKQVVILQNTIGYFASSSDRVSHFIKILDSLLGSWVDERAIKHQSTEQKIYVAKALMTCAGWLKHLKLELNTKEYITQILNGTQIRIGSSEETVQSIGMIVGGHFIKSLDPDAPPLKFECANLDLEDQLKCMLDIPLKPSDNLGCFGDLKCFEEVEFQTKKKNGSENKDPEISIASDDLESDDDLEPYDMSNDLPEADLKRPLYLRDCMMGLVEPEKPEWTEQCLKHAEELIKLNPYATAEVAEEMAKIMLHLADNNSVSDFIALRHRILIALTVQCPLIVTNYLISQFPEKEYTISQRLDILDVLAASSMALSGLRPNLPVSKTNQISSLEVKAKVEADWQIIINERLQAKTKRYTKAQNPTFKENKFSAIAGNFFFPLLNSWEKACSILKVHGDDSYVLGRIIHTLGIIMCAAANTLQCSQMGTTLLQFLSTVRSHEDAFVRRAVIFAVAATFTAVPTSLLFTEMIPDVTDAVEWLQGVAGTDCESDCVEKALYTLSIFQNSASEGSLLYQLKTLTLT